MPPSLIVTASFASDHDLAQLNRVLLCSKKLYRTKLQCFSPMTRAKKLKNRPSIARRKSDWVQWLLSTITSETRTQSLNPMETASDNRRLAILQNRQAIDHLPDALAGIVLKWAGRYAAVSDADQMGEVYAEGLVTSTSKYDQETRNGLSERTGKFVMRRASPICLRPQSKHP